MTLSNYSFGAVANWPELSKETMSEKTYMAILHNLVENWAGLISFSHHHSLKKGDSFHADALDLKFLDK